MQKHVWILLVSFAVHIAPGLSNAEIRKNLDPFPSACQKLIKNVNHQSEKARLDEFFDLAWKHEMVKTPEKATQEGYSGENDRWSDYSLKAIEQDQEEARLRLQVLKSISRSKLNPPDQLSYDLARRKTEEYLEIQRFNPDLLVMGSMGGPEQMVAELFEVSPTKTLQDFEDRILRLRAFPQVLQQIQLLLDEGLKKGIVPAKVGLKNVEFRMDKQLEPDPEQNPMLASFKNMPRSIPAQDQARINKKAAEVLTTEVLPALRKFKNFVVTKYIPKCRESVSWKHMPQGRAWYQALVKKYTGSKKSPREIHEIGLSEVKRIRAEMLKVMSSTEFKGDLQAFNQFMRTDAQFFFHNKQELLERYKGISDHVSLHLKELFVQLPSLPYEVRPVPEYSEASSVTGYYQEGSLLTGRPGIFYANTYNLKVRPRWEMEALFAHEAVPGHHLQISQAMEHKDLPEFRKRGQSVAFSEGWGLYAESLGKELGLYQDPYSNMGRLNYEMWRAIRLVLDTGIHDLGWSRDQAIAFFKENSAKSDHDIEVEVDRYISWPGQALAYKMGELKFKELRALAQKELGASFDVRKFHDAVLKNGGIPMDFLELQIHDWIRMQKRESTSSGATAGRL